MRRFICTFSVLFCLFHCGFGRAQAIKKPKHNKDTVQKISIYSANPVWEDWPANASGLGRGFKEGGLDRVFRHTFQWKGSPNCKIQKAVLELELIAQGPGASNDKYYIHALGRFFPNFMARIFSGKTKFGDKKKLVLNFDKSVIDAMNSINRISLTTQDDTATNSGVLTLNWKCNSNKNGSEFGDS